MRTWLAIVLLVIWAGALGTCALLARSGCPTGDEPHALGVCCDRAGCYTPEEQLERR